PALELRAQALNVENHIKEAVHWEQRRLTGKVPSFKELDAAKEAYTEIAERRTQLSDAISRLFELTQRRDYAVKVNKSAQARFAESTKGEKCPVCGNRL